MCNSCVSIQISPEFGWSIQNKNVFGPGSVFQGVVTISNSNSNNHHNILIQAEKIKVIFSAAESIQAYTVSPGVVRSTKRSIFAVQKTIWDNKSLDITPIKSEYTFPFTIQLPLIQFPPSMDHRIYKSEYKLAAIVNMAGYNSRAMAPFYHSDIPILYMPLVETSILKSPMVINTTPKNSEMTVALKLGSQEYVAGDYADVDLTLSAINTGSKKSMQHKSVKAVIELYQTVKVFAFDDVPDQICIVASASQKMSMELNNASVSPSYGCVASIGLFVPIDLPPSFRGKLISISYALHVRIERSVSLGGIWKRASKISEIPITVGTLGYGIRSSSLLRNYATWGDSISSAAASEESPEMPVPLFMRHIEYEEALPLYESSILPPYCRATTPPSASGN